MHCLGVSYALRTLRREHRKDSWPCGPAPTMKGFCFFPTPRACGSFTLTKNQSLTVGFRDKVKRVGDGRGCKAASCNGFYVNPGAPEGRASGPTSMMTNP